MLRPRCRTDCTLAKRFADPSPSLTKHGPLPFGLAILLIAGGLSADTVYTVSSSADSGAGSLRQAILDANDSPGKDTIQFAIPGNGIHSINLTAALPQIMDPVEIDGTTQPGYNGLPLIELNGANAGQTAHGVLLLAGSCIVRGLAINRFAGDGIHIEGEGTNVIVGNFLGTDPTGRFPRGNGQGGISIFGSSGNRIGGTNGNDGNLISGGNKSGIYLVGPDANANVVLGNLLGTDVTGKRGLGNTENGVVISQGTANLVGGAAANVISGNGESGVYLLGNTTTSNWIQGNLIGTDLNGAKALGNVSDGITLYGAARNIIGGAQPSARNIISGNGARGVFILNNGAVSNWVLGNFIGTDVSGLVAVGNRYAGVAVSGVSGNQIGQILGVDGNLISGNGESGLAITDGAFNNCISGNLIGTDSSGGRALGNRLNGVSINAASNLLGGTVTGSGNIISGNATNGVYLGGMDSFRNVIQGNRIGTDINGLVALPNFYGVGIANSSSNQVGGVGFLAGNLISGNSRGGVYLLGASAVGNQLQGNFIGTDVSGSNALSNLDGGVALYGAPQNLIGGTAPGLGNLISGNARVGLSIGDSGSVGNVIQGNFFGTRIDGASPLGNQLHNIELHDSASTNLIGGLASGAGNRIAFAQGTGYDGVRVRDGCVGNRIRGNSIFSNAGLAIDCATDGPSPAGLVNLTSCVGRYNTRITGTVSGRLPRQKLTLDFYVSATRDSSGYGEGESWIATTTVITDGIGKTNFSITFPATSAVVGYVSATVTDDAGTTSEFGQDMLNSVSPVEDTDNDGLPDEYELAWGLNSTDGQDASQDSDGDGLTNLQEFQCGTSPADPTSYLGLSVTQITDTQVMLSFPSVIGLTYTLKAADSLDSAWQVIANLPGTGGFRVINDVSSSRRTARFYQLSFQ